jgi:hypothetical protein
MDDEVDPNTVTSNTGTACSGSLQVSADSFATCVPMNSQPSYDSSNTVFTLDPASLDGLTTYKVRATAAIKDPAGNSLTPYTSTTGFTTINDPGVVSVTSTSNDRAYGYGAEINIEVNFTSSVFLTGVASLRLNSGGTAVYHNGSGTDMLRFIYSIGPGEKNSNLDYTNTGALTVTGTLKNSSGTDANLTLPAPGDTSSLSGNSNIEVAADIIKVTSSTPDGSYHLDQEILIQVEFASNAVVTGTPLLGMNTGFAASYQSGSGSNTLTFYYKVGPNQQKDFNYDSISSLTQNGGSTIKDNSAIDLGLTLPEMDSNYTLEYLKDITVNSVATFEIVNYDGVPMMIRDTTNRLMWEKCLRNQGTVAGGCELSSTPMTASSAVTYCADLNFGGYTDWYVASTNQYRTIRNGDNSTNVYHNSDFPDVSVDNSPYYFWATNDDPPPAYAWMINFATGSSASYISSGNGYVRCVRKY